MICRRVDVSSLEARQTPNHADSQTRFDFGKRNTLMKCQRKKGSERYDIIRNPRLQHQYNAGRRKKYQSMVQVSILMITWIVWYMRIVSFSLKTTHESTSGEGKPRSSRSRYATKSVFRNAGGLMPLSIYLSLRHLE